MRLLVKLQAEMGCEYVKNYHHKLQGRIWRALEDTPLDQLHDASSVPKFSFSNPFPAKNYSEGDEATVLISSPHRKLIEALQANIQEGDEFNIGEMPFSVKYANDLVVDVGDIGSQGTLQSSVGVYIPLDEEQREKYNITGHRSSDVISWVPSEHPIEAFNERLIENLNWKIEALHSDNMKQPTEIHEVFDSVEFGDTYSVKAPIGDDPTEDFVFIVTQIRGHYTVQSDHQRRWLNTLVESGMGWRNPLGFGFTNIK